MATVTRRGVPVNTNGELPAVGTTAPDFVLTRGDLSDVSLADFAGKKKVLSIVPSLDTPTCIASTHRFNEKAAGLDNAVVLVIAADLPFAQTRFCSAEGINNVVPLSLMRSRKFAKDYGVLMVDGPLQGITRVPWWCSMRTIRSSTPNWSLKSPRNPTTMQCWPLSLIDGTRTYADLRTVATRSEQSGAYTPR